MEGNLIAPGGTPENSWWGVPPGFLNPDPISDQKMSFSDPFSDLAKELLRWEQKQKKIS